jgi:hypothetical protein
MRSHPIAALAAAVLLAPLVTPVLPDADAAVLCQRKKKVVVRDTACKAKETLVQDLGGLATGVQQLGSDVQQLGGSLQQLGTTLGGQKSRLDFVVGQLRLECPGAPERVRADSDESFLYESYIECGGGCRIHDGDPAACNAAWAVGTDGGTSCFPFDGLCLPCGGCGEYAGACTNACLVVPSPGCEADPTRTIYAGQAGSQACEHFTDQTSCEKAWHVGRNGPATCYWNGGSCRGCGPSTENNGYCVNTCRVTACAAPGRTNLQDCDSINADEALCAASYQVARNGSGLLESCRFDANDGCVACTLYDELQGRCDNVCR